MAGLVWLAHRSCLVYEVHDLEALHPSKARRWPRAFWRWFLPWLDRTALGRTRKLVSLTGTFRDWVVDRGLREASDIAVIPDAFDPETYSPMDKQQARVALGLPEDGYIIGYAGLTFAYRRLDLLVEAFAKIAQTCDNALLVLVGGRSGEIAELRAEASRLDLQRARLVMPGQVDQERAALFLNAADVLVIPDTVTQMTASPLKLFEYMAVGKPVVLKDMPALREIVDDSAAEYFAAGDAEALASALGRLMDDPTRAEGIAAAALQRSRAYTYRGRAERILDVVRNCQA